jgi:hypothetical protein
MDGWMAGSPVGREPHLPGLRPATAPLSTRHDERHAFPVAHTQMYSIAIQTQYMYCIFVCVGMHTHHPPCKVRHTCATEGYVSTYLRIMVRGAPNAGWLAHSPAVPRPSWTSPSCSTAGRWSQGGRRGRLGSAATVGWRAILRAVTVAECCGAWPPHALDSASAQKSQLCL